MSSFSVSPLVVASDATVTKARVKLAKVLDSLDLVPGTLKFWSDYFGEEGMRESLLDSFFMHANPALIPILASDTPPTVAQLAALGWTDVKDRVGVYIKVLIPLRNDLQSCLYTGSAGSVNHQSRKSKWGLERRMDEHQRDFERDNKASISDNFWNLLLKKHPDQYRFQPAWLWKRRVDEKNLAEVTLTRRQTIIFEALLCISLGSYRTYKQDVTRLLTLWPWDAMEYAKGNRSFPLSEPWSKVADVKAVYGPEEVKAREKRRRDGEDVKHLLSPLEFEEYRKGQKAAKVAKSRKGEAKRGPRKQTPKQLNVIRQRTLIRDRTKRIKLKEQKTGVVLTEEERQAILTAPVKKHSIAHLPDDQLTRSQRGNRRTRERYSRDPEAKWKHRKWDRNAQEKEKAERKEKRDAEERDRFERVLKEQAIWEHNQQQAGKSGL